MAFGGVTPGRLPSRLLQSSVTPSTMTTRLAGTAAVVAAVVIATIVVATIVVVTIVIVAIMVIVPVVVIVAVVIVVIAARFRVRLGPCLLGRRVEDRWDSNAAEPSRTERTVTHAHGVRALEDPGAESCVRYTVGGISRGRVLQKIDAPNAA